MIMVDLERWSVNDALMHQVELKKREEQLLRVDQKTVVCSAISKADKAEVLGGNDDANFVRL